MRSGAGETRGIFFSRTPVIYFARPWISQLRGDLDSHLYNLIYWLCPLASYVRQGTGDFARSRWHRRIGSPAIPRFSSRPSLGLPVSIGGGA